LAAPMTTKPSDWNFNGSATYDATALTAVLTPATNSQAGTVIYKNPIVNDAFDVTFDFKISTHGADRLGFMIEKNSNTAVGHDGGGFAMSGLTGFGVEIDTYRNDNACSENDNNHTGVDVLTPCSSNADVPTPIAVSSNLSTLYGYDLGDNTWRTCVVHMAG